MMTVEQIRAARALLNWTQADLAAAAGLSLPSINAIERDVASPRKGTLQAVRAAFDGAGVEFIGTEGVTLHREIFSIQPFEGEFFLKKLYDDIFSCLKGPQDRIDMLGVDERKFSEYGGSEVIRYFDYQQKTRFKERILIRENDTFLLAPPETYRWISDELVGTIPYLVYKDRFAMILWKLRRVVLVRNPSVADSYRRQFEFLWRLGHPVPRGTDNRLNDPAFRAKQQRGK